MKSKKKMTTLFFTMLTALALVPTATVLAGTTTFGTAHRGAWSTETMQIHYSGGVFFYPHYATHTHVGYAKYTRNGKTVASKWTTYVKNNSKYSSKTKIEANISCWDTLNPTAPKTKFHYGFN
ncbi:hypothetical protein [Lactobacillus delbrueckii]|uniref:hypothetical protein n=1 Tax=Lactobacillus delbrueckii TaxID=1584 RepID=UPI00068037FF|nr:hypothetical protein [Lactobacillus delbrueckii]APP03476.1 hypothetical protein LI610_08445 [Lactobacillus delbrueckii subsp. indicus]KNE30106.1 hypothetical protein LDI10_07595 [Lactobacillus delbrueckii subsp. indicus]